MIQTMTGNLQPLDQKFPIVTPDGRPTLYFIKWAQQKQIDIGSGITAEQAVQIITQYLADHELQAGSGIQITPSGNLSDTPTIAAEVQVILDQITDVRGSILFRGAAGWEALAPGLSGQFLKTMGAGADPVWAAGGGGGGNYALIQTQVLAAAAATITFSSISNAYKDLKLVLTGRGTNSSNEVDVRLQLNGDTAGNYDGENLWWYSNGSNTSQFIAQTSAQLTGGFPAATAPTDAAGQIEVSLGSYSDTTFQKTGLVDWMSKNSTGGFSQGRGMTGFSWRNTAAIDTVTFLLSAGNFAIGTRASLYGIG